MTRIFIRQKRLLDNRPAVIIEHDGQRDQHWRTVTINGPCRIVQTDGHAWIETDSPVTGTNEQEQ